MEIERYIDQAHIGPDMFNQWQIYPENQSWHDPTEFDLESYAERLHDDAPRVLGDSTNVVVLTVHYSQRDGALENLPSDRSELACDEKIWEREQRGE
jgi:hypothetical protein